jgi:predicted esterase
VVVGRAGRVCRGAAEEDRGHRLFVAMSVFKPKQLPPLEQAKGHAFYLYHSPTDEVCPFSMAKDAFKQLEKNGAKVYLHEYEGGHGWEGDYSVDVRGGIEWLEKNVAAKK